MKLRKLIIRNICLLIIVVFLPCALFQYFDNNIVKEIEPPKPTSTSFSLVMVGDALIHSAVYDTARTSDGFDFKPMLKEMKPIISSYDLAFYNQETILGGSELGLSTYPRFNTPYEEGDAFLDCGFNLVGMANNHTLDRGEPALQNSLKYWSDKNVYTAGSYSSFEDRDDIEIATKNGITYALLSYTTTTNGLKAPQGKEYYVNVYSEELAKKNIESVRDKVDVIIVAMHWGSEYTHTPTNQEKTIANYLSSLGVDIIIGHHPHVVQPIEFINDTLVVYSLGNFISSQVGIERLTGLMVALNVNKDLATNEISFSDIEAELLYTDKKGKYVIYPYTKLNNSILSNYETYYNKYMSIVLSSGDTRIQKGDYSGNSK